MSMMPRWPTPPIPCPGCGWLNGEHQSACQFTTFILGGREEFYVLEPMPQRPRPPLPTPHVEACVKLDCPE